MAYVRLTFPADKNWSAGKFRNCSEECLWGKLICELVRSHFSLFTKLHANPHSAAEKLPIHCPGEITNALETLFSKKNFASSHLAASVCVWHTRERLCFSLLSFFHALAADRQTFGLRSDFASAAWPLRHYKSLKAYLGALFVSPLNIQYYFLFRARISLI